MGFTELKPGQAHQVTVELKGPCDPKKATRYKAALRRVGRQLARQFGARRIHRRVVKLPKRRKK
jgi:hypothetical protein